MLKEVLCSRCFFILIGRTALWFAALRFQTQPTRQLISKHESSHVTSVRIVFLESSCSFQKQRVALDAQMSTLYKMSCCFLQAWILSACVSCGSVLEQYLLRRRRGPSFTNLPQCYTWYRRTPLEGRWPPEPSPPHAAPTAHVAASARRCCYSALNTAEADGKFICFAPMLNWWKCLLRSHMFTINVWNKSTR